MRKTLLYYLLQGIYILPTDNKENLFKRSYNCFGLKDMDSQMGKKKKRYLDPRKCVGRRKTPPPPPIPKSSVGYKLQVKNEFSSETVHSNPCFIIFNCSLPKTFGLDILYTHGCPPGQRELHKPH